MATVLDKIFAHKKEELGSTKRNAPLSEIKGRVGQQQTLKDVEKALGAGSSTRIIAEIKKKTPFKGELRPGFDGLEIARTYAENGAAAISVLTESNYFGGSIDFLSQVRELVDVPLLRKDFIFDEYQVHEARAFGADFFLLIATWLDKNHLRDLLELGKELGMPALVETHCEKDMEKAFAIGGHLLGINNRDLKTGKTDLGISHRLLKMAAQVPKTLMVCESGIHSAQEIQELGELGAHAFLIGESLMKAENIAEKLSELRGVKQEEKAEKSP
ncbi:MAG: indole-3-glycerol-phosphate synthase [Nitrospinaceae bacterium]|nr:MAG: indole-3-glycerol-phosphate synthase [Nitrospinaceae bacterium]